MKLIFTIIYPGYTDLYAKTVPSLRRYAERIKADFQIVRALQIFPRTENRRFLGCWEKFQAYSFLERYERIIFMDADVFVSRDCENLFDVVPVEKVGAMNECLFHPWDQNGRVEACCGYYDEPLQNWDAEYYNTGVIVASRCHREVFKHPGREFPTHSPDQDYFNMVVHRDKTPMFDLTWNYNAIPFNGLGDRGVIPPVCGVDINQAEIIHFACAKNKVAWQAQCVITRRGG